MRINSGLFAQALKDHDLSHVFFIREMQRKHKCFAKSKDGKTVPGLTTLKKWFNRGAADPYLFECAVDTLNEYESEHGWKRKRVSPYMVDDFML